MFPFFTLVPTCTAWWWRHKGMNNLPMVVVQQCPSSSRACDPWLLVRRSTRSITASQYYTIHRISILIHYKCYGNANKYKQNLPSYWVKGMGEAVNVWISATSGAPSLTWRNSGKVKQEIVKNSQRTRDTTRLQKRRQQKTTGKGIWTLENEAGFKHSCKKT